MGEEESVPLVVIEKVLTRLDTKGAPVTQAADKGLNCNGGLSGGPTITCSHQCWLDDSRRSSIGACVEQ